MEITSLRNVVVSIEAMGGPVEIMSDNGEILESIYAGGYRINVAGLISDEEATVLFASSSEATYRSIEFFPTSYRSEIIRDENGYQFCGDIEMVAKQIYPYAVALRISQRLMPAEVSLSHDFVGASLVSTPADRRTEAHKEPVVEPAKEIFNPILILEL